MELYQMQRFNAENSSFLINYKNENRKNKKFLIRFSVGFGLMLFVFLMLNIYYV